MPENVHLNNIKDVMTKTRLSRSKIYEEMASGRLRSVSVGRRRLVPETALVDYVNDLITTAAADGTRATAEAADETLQRAKAQV